MIFGHTGEQAFVRTMRPAPVVAPHEVIFDVRSGRDQTLVTKRWQPLRFEASEKARHRRIITTVPSAAHALDYAVSPKQASKTPACILTSLIGMKHQTLWVATAFQGPLQSVHYKLGIGLLTNCDQMTRRWLRS